MKNDYPIELSGSNSIQNTLDSIRNLANTFINDLDVKKSSKETYSREIKQFVEFWYNNLSGRINLSREDILNYKKYLTEDKALSPLTVSSYILIVRKFFEWLEGKKGYPNIAKGIKGAKRARGFRKDPLVLHQIKTLLLSIPRNTLRGKRDYAIINLLIRTGLRTIEVVRADVSDIRQEGGEAVLWIQGKGREIKDEFVVLTPETLNPIYEYLSLRKIKCDSEPLFASVSIRNKNERLTTRSVSRIVKTCLRNAGINNRRLTAHSLRHTAITLALQAGATIQEAQALGRHSNINTTLIYAHNVNRILNAPERKIDKLLDSIDND
ncbi:MAG: tyrosine-type recombinase/integrase [Caldisericia bacterium]|jgi:integrase/recombinase XerC/integrase/recombinase XerD|nr:tyrosine-type recombinase/integrase [Caldisericia bacterium]MDD5689242.1 tyrosine-type recombinase/integrase [Caldisericia bacterium]HOJ16599.1 tyrosine-type recombinase/integrase [Caldisericia bacterium]HPO28985.1 tyrosine-type recombinase/integrase [Caldisericia bacterium]HXK70629.1 tyrosine-type recombinase/integrase [Caldisericia bacterium]